MFNTTLTQSGIIERLKATTEGIFLTLAAFIFAAIAGAFLFSIGQNLGLVGAAESFSGRLTNIVALQLFAFPLLAYTYLTLTDRDLTFIDIRTPTRFELSLATAGVLTLIVVNLGIVAAFTFANLPVSESELTNLDNPLYYIVLAAISLFIVAPAEELLFRGVIQKRLMETYSTPAAILVSSLIFALPHYRSLVVADGRVASIVTIVALGCILGIVYARTENLTVPIIAHGVFNMITFLSNYADAALLG